MTDREFLLARLRQATIQARLIEAELTSIGVALKGDMIDAESALMWLRGAGLLWMVQPLPVEAEQAMEPEVAAE
jgi:hypothetical protein